MLLIIPDLCRMQRRDALEPRRQCKCRLYARVQLIPGQQPRIARIAARNSAALRILPTCGGSPARKDRLSFGEGWGRGILSWTAPRDETYIKLRRSFGRSQGGRYRSDSGSFA